MAGTPRTLSIFKLMIFFSLLRYLKSRVINHCHMLSCLLIWSAVPAVEWYIHSSVHLHVTHHFVYKSVWKDWMDFILKKKRSIIHWCGFIGLCFHQKYVRITIPEHCGSNDFPMCVCGLLKHMQHSACVIRKSSLALKIPLASSVYPLTKSLWVRMRERESRGEW